MVCRACGLEHGPLMRCEVAARLATNGTVVHAGHVTTSVPPVTSLGPTGYVTKAGHVTTCRECVVKDAEAKLKDAEIERLRGEVLRAARLGKPKRDRAAYMRAYRSRGQTT